MQLGFNEIGSAKHFLRKQIEVEFDKRVVPVESGGVMAAPPAAGAGILGSALVPAMSEYVFKRHLIDDLGFTVKQARGAFNTFNTNADTTIERDEFVLFYIVSKCYTVLVDLIAWRPDQDLELARWQIKWLYAIYDDDGNNHMDIAEFRVMIRDMQVDKSYTVPDVDIDTWIREIGCTAYDGIAVGPRFDEFYQAMNNIAAARYVFFTNHSLNPGLALDSVPYAPWPRHLPYQDPRVLHQWKIKSGVPMTFRPVADLGLNKALEDGFSYYNDDRTNACVYIAKYESNGLDPVVVYSTRCAPFDPFVPFEFQGVWLTRRTSVHVVKYDVRPHLLMDTDNQVAPFHGVWALLASAGKQQQELKRDAIISLRDP